VLLKILSEINIVNILCITWTNIIKVSQHAQKIYQDIPRYIKIITTDFSMEVSHDFLLQTFMIGVTVSQFVTRHFHVM
jgi:hypothetical protein